MYEHGAINFPLTQGTGQNPGHIVLLANKVMATKQSLARPNLLAVPFV